ncbi:hypothetical protein TNCV_4724951 [Trichonephila clavipes]|uniref:Uncharacterized protein n=1 Tax=Trichonephila clavipes TaxID=2585209 RepID=A0A8X6W6W1_TRICX|nr:hypothetical protein TNCV_4724951 [Trichonephila clavipes]
MDRISICEALAKRNEIDPFLKWMVTRDEKWVPLNKLILETFFFILWPSSASLPLVDEQPNKVTTKQKKNPNLSTKTFESIGPRWPPSISPWLRHKQNPSLQCDANSHVRCITLLADSINLQLTVNESFDVTLRQRRVRMGHERSCFPEMLQWGGSPVDFPSSMNFILQE